MSGQRIFAIGIVIIFILICSSQDRIRFLFLIFGVTSVGSSSVGFNRSYFINTRESLINFYVTVHPFGL